MECIVADWEVRNLGCNVLELRIQPEDKIEEVPARIEVLQKKYDAGYIAVKCPSNLPRYNWILPQYGFFLVESQIILKQKRSSIEAEVEKAKALFPDVLYRHADEADAEQVVREIERGIFKTDRIALDPAFGIDVANKRYANWVRDEVGRGSDLIIATYDGQDIGFTLGRGMNKREYHGLLLGEYEDRNVQGFGALINYVGMQNFLTKNYRYQVGAVSSNNPRVLQLYLYTGSTIRAIENVFVKHY